MSNRIIYDRPVVVTGATGKQGGAVARELLARGHTVRAITRSPNKDAAKALAAKGAEVVKADLEDRDSLDVALKDAAALFSVQDFLEAGIEAEIRQGLNLTAAAADCKTLEHVVYSGASTMDRNTGVPHLDSKWQVETQVRELATNWTVFRPAAFLENWEWDRETIMKTGVMNHPGRPNMIYKQVSVEDIAVMTAIALEDPDHWGRQIAPLCGDAQTPIELAESLSRVTGKQIAYKQLSWADCEAQQGEELTSMYRYFDEFGMNGDPVQMRFWNPRALSFEAYLRKAGWAET